MTGVQTCALPIYKLLIFHLIYLFVCLHIIYHLIYHCRRTRSRAAALFLCINDDDIPFAMKQEYFKNMKNCYKLTKSYCQWQHTLEREVWTARIKTKVSIVVIPPAAILSAFNWEAVWLRSPNIKLYEHIAGNPSS